MSLSITSLHDSKKKKVKKKKSHQQSQVLKEKLHQELDKFALSRRCSVVAVALWSLRFPS